MSLTEIAALIADVPDFPRPGILFKDITPLLAEPNAFRETTELLAQRVEGMAAAAILAVESRGFVFGAALAARLGLPLQLVRKRGKLPRATVSVKYELEYGVDHLELHADAVTPGGRYLIVDDVIATGGTAAAVAQLVQEQRGVVASCVFVLELTFLDGRKRLAGHDVVSLIRF